MGGLHLRCRAGWRVFPGFRRAPVLLPESSCLPFGASSCEVSPGAVIRSYSVVNRQFWPPLSTLQPYRRNASGELPDCYDPVNDTDGETLVARRSANGARQPADGWGRGVEAQRRAAGTWQPRVTKGHTKRRPFPRRWHWACPFVALKFCATLRGGFPDFPNARARKSGSAGRFSEFPSPRAGDLLQQLGKPAAEAPKPVHGGAVTRKTCREGPDSLHGGPQSRKTCQLGD